jgi:hypothetical protein
VFVPELVNVGTVAGDGTGDKGQVPFDKVNTNFVSVAANLATLYQSNILNFGADPTGATPSDAAFVAAFANATATGLGFIYCPAGVYVTQNPLTPPSGVIIVGDSITCEYYPASAFNTLPVTVIWRQAAGGALPGNTGPIFILNTATGLQGLYLKYDYLGGSATGVVQLGTTNAAGATTSSYNVHLDNVEFHGPAIAAGVLVDTTATAIYFWPGSVANTVQRYANKFTNIVAANFVNGAVLGENCNANNFLNINFRSVYNHYVLSGGAGGICTENNFSGLISFNVGALPTAATFVFTLSNGASNNVFNGYSTECNGSAFSIAAGCTGNVFLGQENEVYPSVVPPGNFHSAWAPPGNRDQLQAMIVPTVAAPLNYTTGQGVKLSRAQSVGGTLPQLNGNGTLVAANVNSKVFLRFSSLMSAPQGTSFLCDLNVALGAPGGGYGISIVQVKFWLRITNNTALPASLSVITVNQKPAGGGTNYVAGLKFLTGVAAALPYGLAIVGGNVGAVSANLLWVDFNMSVFTYSTNAVNLAGLEQVTWGCVAASANDVTDAIDLLTVADTAFTA